jgi:hypothetical protein
VVIRNRNNLKQDKFNRTEAGCYIRSSLQKRAGFVSYRLETNYCTEEGRVYRLQVRT